MPAHRKYKRPQLQRCNYRFKTDDKISIVTSVYVDVTPGVKGIIVKRYQGGYAVRIACSFHDARGKRDDRPRIMWFEDKELRKAYTHNV